MGGASVNKTTSDLQLSLLKSTPSHLSKQLSFVNRLTYPTARSMASVKDILESSLLSELYTELFSGSKATHDLTKEAFLKAAVDVSPRLKQEVKMMLTDEEKLMLPEKIRAVYDKLTVTATSIKEVPSTVKAILKIIHMYIHPLSPLTENGHTDAKSLTLKGNRSMADNLLDVEIENVCTISAIKIPSFIDLIFPLRSLEQRTFIVNSIENQL